VVANEARRGPSLHVASIARKLVKYLITKGSLSTKDVRDVERNNQSIEFIQIHHMVDGTS
jgi:hypothetical protein